MGGRFLKGGEIGFQSYFFHHLLIMEWITIQSKLKIAAFSTLPGWAMSFSTILREVLIMRNFNRLLAGAAVLGLAGFAAAVTQDTKQDAPQKKGKLDPAALQEAAFKRADADGDGKISKEELKKFLETARQGRPARPGSDNKDKKEGDAPKKEGDAPKRPAINVDEAFKKLDANSDGSIDKEEFKKVREVMGGGRPPRGGDKKTQ